MNSIKECRLCKSCNINIVISFGQVALANSYPESNQENEDLFPLTVVKCKDCNHIQLKETIEPKKLFSNYSYASSDSPSLVKHFKEENGVDIPYPLIPDYIFRLRADNSTYVDPATGEYVQSSFPNAIGEADYFIQVIAANPIAIDTLSEQMITRGDIYERFNNYPFARIVTWM